MTAMHDIGKVIVGAPMGFSVTGRTETASGKRVMFHGFVCCAAICFSVRLILCWALLSSSAVSTS